jgi:hypothetical protein
VKACAHIVGRERTKVLLLQGPTGCGKSSFLRAGLIPYLESEVARFQFVQIYDINDVKALFIRSTEAPLIRLCEYLYDWGETPFPIHLPDADPEKVSMAEVRGGKDRLTFIRENAASVPKLIEVLRAVEKRLPKTAVMVIDQGEEVLTLNDRDNEHNKRLLFDFLIGFSETTIDLKIIVALRKEYFGDFYEELSKRRFSLEHVSFFLLGELSTEQLVEVIRFPTSRNIPPKHLQGRPQPGDHYNFDFEASLPEKIVSGLRSIKTAEGGILPVLQVTCERLFRTARAQPAWALAIEPGETLDHHVVGLGAPRRTRSADRSLRGRNYSGGNPTPVPYVRRNRQRRRACVVEGPPLHDGAGTAGQLSCGAFAASTTVSNRWRKLSLSRKRPCRFLERLEWPGTLRSRPSRQNRR